MLGIEHLLGTGFISINWLIVKMSCSELLNFLIASWKIHSSHSNRMTKTWFLFLLWMMQDHKIYINIMEFNGANCVWIMLMPLFCAFFYSNSSPNKIYHHFLESCGALPIFCFSGDFAKCILTSTKLFSSTLLLLLDG